MFDKYFSMVLHVIGKYNAISGELKLERGKQHTKVAIQNTFKVGLCFHYYYASFEAVHCLELGTYSHQKIVVLLF